MHALQLVTKPSIEKTPPILHRNTDNMKRNADRLKKRIREHLNKKMEHQTALDAISCIYNWGSWNEFYLAVTSKNDNPEYRWWHNLRHVEKLEALLLGRARFLAFMRAWISQGHAEDNGQSETSLKSAKSKLASFIGKLSIKKEGEVSATEQIILSIYAEITPCVVEESCIPEAYQDQATEYVVELKPNAQSLIPYGEFSKERRREGLLYLFGEHDDDRLRFFEHVKNSLAPSFNQSGIVWFLNKSDVLPATGVLDELGYTHCFIDLSLNSRSSDFGGHVLAENVLSLFGLDTFDSEEDTFVSLSRCIHSDNEDYSVMHIMALRLAVSAFFERKKVAGAGKVNLSTPSIREALYYYLTPEAGQAHYWAKRLLDGIGMSSELSKDNSLRQQVTSWRNCGNEASDFASASTLEDKGLTPGIGMSLTKLAETYGFSIMPFFELLKVISGSARQVDTGAFRKFGSVAQKEAVIVVMDQENHYSSAFAYAAKKRLMLGRANVPHDLRSPLVVISRLTELDNQQNHTEYSASRRSFCSEFFNGEPKLFDAADFVLVKCSGVYPVSYCEINSSFRLNSFDEYFATIVAFKQQSDELVLMDSMSCIASLANFHSGI